jgi:hypothetical protein
MDNGASVELISQVPEAQVMVAAQVDCTADEALVLLTDRAKATGLRLEEVAIAVVQSRTRFRHASGQAPV